MRAQAVTKQAIGTLLNTLGSCHASSVSNVTIKVES